MAIALTDLEPRGWRVGDHARRRAAELGYDLHELVLAASDPEQSYPADDRRGGVDRRVCQRGDIAVVVSDLDATIVTVVLRTDVEWKHGLDRREVLQPAQPPVGLPERRATRRSGSLPKPPERVRHQLTLTDALAMVRDGYSVPQAARLSGYDAEVIADVLGIEDY